MTTRTPRLRRRRLALAGLSVALFSGARLAHAGDASVSSSTTVISPELFAARFAVGSDAGAPAHFNNFSPLAINYLDCVDQIDLEFNLHLANPPAGDEIQVWAGIDSAACTEVSARTAGTSSDPGSFPGKCWPVAAPGAFSTSGSLSTARVHVLDLVANLGNDTLSSSTYAQTITTTYCKPRASITSAVPLNIYFMFVLMGSGTNGADVAAVDGVAGLYTTPAALVGPFAPTGVVAPNDGIAANSLSVNWVPQGQSIIQGFNIYVEDQGPSGAEAGAGAAADASPSSQHEIVCRQPLACTVDAGMIADAGKDAKDASAVDADASGTETGTKTPDAGAHDATLADAGGVADAAAEGTTTSTPCDGGLSDASFPVDAAAYPDASAAALAAIGCSFTTATSGFGADAGQVSPTTCKSAVLVDLFTVDGGQGSAATTESDASSTLLSTVSGSDAGAETGTSDLTVDSGEIATGSSSATVSEVAGISNISGGRLAAYVSGGTTNSYTLSGLTTGSQYAIAVAAVDSYGNIGPLGYAVSPLTGESTGGVVTCSTPTLVDDFLTQYGIDGGQAGGGFCSLTRLGAPAPFFGSIFGAGIAGAAVARGRRRRKARRNS